MELHPSRIEADARRGINISVSKTPERIAAEISRRLLPTYLPILAVALADKARHDVSEAEQRAFENALAVLLAATRPEQGYRDRIGFGCGHGHGGYFRVTGDTVQFEFRLPRTRALDLAPHLAAVLAADAAAPSPVTPAALRYRRSARTSTSPRSAAPPPRSCPEGQTRKPGSARSIAHSPNSRRTN